MQAGYRKNLGTTSRTPYIGHLRPKPAQPPFQLRGTDQGCGDLAQVAVDPNDLISRQRGLNELQARNPDVVAQVLSDAYGICASCRKEALFHKKKNSQPYLEVHRKTQLANNGLDTVETPKLYAQTAIEKSTLVNI